MTTRVDGINITDGVITEAKLQTKLNPDNAVDSNAFNIGVLGFKLAVNDGLTVFNLIDGVVDEFHSNTGVDTSESTNSLYDSSGDFFSNQQVNNVELLLTTSIAHLADPSQAPILTYNAQVVGATEAQAIADTTSYPQYTSSTNYYKATQLTSFANIVVSVTTSCTATLIGGGGGSYPGGPNNGGAGGSVKSTINDPEMGGTTWDIMVAGGGYKNATPQLPTGGIGGGGHGVHCQGGGASVIFNGEATIQQGGMYAVDDSGPSPFSNPQGTPGGSGGGHGGTARYGSAPLTVLAVGGGLVIYMHHILVVLLEILVKVEEVVMVLKQLVQFHIQRVHLVVEEEAQHHLTTLHQLLHLLVLKVVVELVLQLKQEMVYLGLHNILEVVLVIIHLRLDSMIWVVVVLVTEVVEMVGIVV